MRFLILLIGVVAAVDTTTTTTLESEDPSAEVEDLLNKAFIGAVDGPFEADAGSCVDCEEDLASLHSILIDLDDSDLESADTRGSDGSE